MSKLVQSTEYLLRRIAAFEDGNDIAEGLEELVDNFEDDLGAYNIYYAKEAVVHLEGVTDLLREVRLFLKHVEKSK